jgi:hypothetical protein
MANARATLNVTPSTRVDVTGSAGLSIFIASVKVVGSISPLVEAKMPATSFLQVRSGQLPCWSTNVHLNLKTMSGKIELVVYYLVNTYHKVIANWAGYSKDFTLLDLGQPCINVVQVNPLPMFP